MLKYVVLLLLLNNELWQISCRIIETKIENTEQIQVVEEPVRSKRATGGWFRMSAIPNCDYLFHGRCGKASERLTLNSNPVKEVDTANKDIYLMADRVEVPAEVPTEEINENTKHQTDVQEEDPIIVPLS